MPNEDKEWQKTIEIHEILKEILAVQSFTDNDYVKDCY